MPPEEEELHQTEHSQGVADGVQAGAQLGQLMLGVGPEGVRR